MKKFFIRHWFGLVLGFAASSCTTLAFNYQSYVIHLEEGTLQGAAPKDDLSLSDCKHDDQGYHCMAMMIPEFYRLRGDKLKCDLDLTNCQKNCP